MSAIDLTRKKGELETLIVNAKAIYAKMETDPAQRTPENRESFDKMVTDGKALRAEVDRLEDFNKLGDGLGFASDGKTAPGVGAAGSSGVPTPAGGDGSYAQPFRAKSWGQRVIESPTFKTASQNWREGKMARVKVTDAFDPENPGAYPDIKAITSTPASGGYTYRADRQPEIVDAARQRPFSVLDIINTSQTTVDSVEYVELSSRTNNAAVVPELDPARVHVAAGGADAIAADNGNFGENFAMKPKGDLLFALKSALVKTISEWIPASRQILADAPRLRAMIDNELTYMIRVKLEDMIVSANETGFVGLLNALNIGTRVHRVSGRGFTAGDTVADTLRRMQTDIQLAFYEMDTYVVSPQVAEALELEKAAGSGAYYNVFDPVTQRVWRKRVAVSNALNGGNAGTAIAGNFQIGATLWDRMDVDIRVGEPGNFFLENAVAVLAEIRAAFAVIRGPAFEKASGLPV